MSGTIRTKRELSHNILAQVDDCSLSKRNKIDCLKKAIKTVRENK